MNKMMEINIKPLTRVEGEGEVEIVVENGNVKKIQVEIIEAPRFFEAFVRGRKYLEVPDFVARICGLCPVPYIYSSSRAMEKILEINIPKEIQNLRKTLLLGEWISSHSTTRIPTTCTRLHETKRRNRIGKNKAGNS
jgi:coenzyme F420-reducing hydrogenase alpha subunit